MLFKRRTDNVGFGPSITATMATSVSRELESLPPDWISPIFRFADAAALAEPAPVFDFEKRGA